MKSLVKLIATLMVTFFSMTLFYAGCASDGPGTLQVTIEGSGRVTSLPAGIDCPPDCSTSFSKGTIVELTAEPAEGFEFTGWSGGGCQGTGICIVEIVGSTNVTATFIQNRLVFSSQADLNGNPNEVFNIFTINQDGTELRALTMLTNTIGERPDSSVPQWSPDNSKIVYISSRAFDGSDNANFFGTDNVWVMDADGSNNMPLTQIGADQANSFNPVWSPDDTKIAFESSRAINGDDANIDVSNIWVVDADGGNPTPLTTNVVSGADNYEPQWSPDGSQILFYATKDLDPMVDAPNNPPFNVSNVWIMNSDGSNQRPLTKLTASSADCSGPKWAPDGTEIVYNANRSLNSAEDMANTNNTPNIWIMEADGNNSSPLTDYTQAGVFTFEPSFSPDGLKILFYSNGNLDGLNMTTDDTSRNIWVIDADGNNLTPLTLYNNAAVDQVYAQSPVYSADGSRIAFRSNGALDGSNAFLGVNVNNLFIMHSDGSELAPLTTNTQMGTNSFDQEFVNQP